MTKSQAEYEQLCCETDPWSEIPPRYNLGVGLTTAHVASGRGDHPCLLWENSADDSRRLTYADLDDLSTRLAAALGRLGVQLGDRVLLRLPNLPEFYIASLAIAKLGAVFIPSSTLFRAADIEYRVRDANVVAAITTTHLAGELETARENCPTLRHLVAVPYADVPLSGEQIDFNQLLAQPHDGFQPADTASDDVAFIIYTSGTTGDPKGVVHYHRYPLSFESLIRHWHDYREDDICSCPAELGWLLPVASTFLYAMRVGMTIALYHPLDGRFDAPAWLRLIEKYRITNFVATPTIYRMLTADPGIDTADLSSLRHGVSAGEPLPADTLQSVRQRMGFVPLDGIGMSECMVYCFNMQGFDVVPDSCGRPAPGCEIKLMDEEGNEVPDGEEGVMYVRRSTHPGMMKEYLNKPEQTADIFRGEWYYSGDVLSCDEQGRYWFKGRSDDLIKASGYRISPFDVESTLSEHPAVLEVAAVASPDPVRGNVVKAYIVLREGHDSSSDLVRELQNWVKQNAAAYKYPRKIEFVEELPKTQSGKIKRRLLRDREFTPDAADPS